MDYIGLSCGFHDAAVSVIDSSGNIVFAGHSERYSKHKHDDNLCVSIITDALKYTETYPVVTISIGISQQLRIAVEDNGIGINKNDLIWWTDQDVYITHTAEYVETSDETTSYTYWNHPLTGAITTKPVKAATISKLSFISINLYFGVIKSSTPSYLFVAKTPLTVC